MEPCSKEAELKELKTGADDRNLRLSRIEDRQIGLVQDFAHFKARSNTIVDGQNTLEKKLISVAGDVLHVRERIDNGLSHTVKEMHDCMIRQEPEILHCKKWVNRLEAACVAALYGIALLGCGVIVWAFTKGFHP